MRYFLKWKGSSQSIHGPKGEKGEKGDSAEKFMATIETIMPEKVENFLSNFYK